MAYKIEAAQAPRSVSPHDLWVSPSTEALEAEWKIPDSVRIVLASQSVDKIAGVNAVLEQHGSRLTGSLRVPEEMIKDLLKWLWVNEKKHTATIAARVVNIAGFKSILAADTDALLGTHSIGLDTDVVVLGNIAEQGEPIGRPTSPEELLETLNKISGRVLDIKTAAAFADLETMNILAMEEARIRLKLISFDPMKYLDIFGLNLNNQVPGAIDFSKPEAAAFLDQNFMLQVTRMTAFSEQDSAAMSLVHPEEAHKVLGDYFKGCPKDLINWVIYHGLKAEFSQPFPV